MAITAAQVKELREMTGAGMMDCKKALTETDGDMDKRGWDPTDPDPVNPWDDSFESGTAIRSQAAWDQWENEHENWMSSLTPTDLQGWSTDSKIEGTRG